MITLNRTGSKWARTLATKEGSLRVIKKVIPRLVARCGATDAFDHLGLLICSGNDLDGSLARKGGRPYRQSDAICLDPQIWPGTPNRSNFLSASLTPGSIYGHQTVNRFAAAGHVR